ncbi:unnamed protein product [Caenorhabditis auriculariae]|uniref:Exportin-4 n=1 Tax=Caenorhabditis auriculariae TaxID=2777116 RepID=A0A8S1H9T7_9PELO|nr:unnamed protein product [Caenorhabditis auriculariae]
MNRFDTRNKYSFQTTNAFRPPVAWKDLLDADEFYIIFFKLHSKIRNDEDLCMKSMNCLIQLASLTGDCIPVQDPESSIRYVTLYISNLLDLFREGPLPWEVNHFCTIINRLFLYRPLSSILKLDANLRAQFFKFLTEYTLYLTRDAMSKAIGQGIHSEHTSLSVIYDAVVVLLRGRWRVTVRDEEEEQLIDNEICIQPSVRMMEEFIQCVLAPPLGTRPPCQEEDDVDDNDDRVLFNDLLTPLSQMMCYNIGHFTRSMIATLRGTSSELKQMAGSNDVSRMPTWQEDQHWLMLILANSVVGEEEDGSCHLASEVVEFSADLLKAGTVFDEEPKKAFLNMCILNPTDDRSVYDQRVNPFILLMGELLSWASLEHQLFTSASGEMISPELCRSTLFALKRFINAAGSCSSEDVNNLPLVMPKDAEFSLTLVEFVIHKVFTVLAKFSGEAKLCKDAIATLVGLVESYASVIASSSVFFDYLSNFDISQIPNRTNLMRALVLIGASANDAQLQENMFNMILAPLCQRFAELSEKPSSSDVDSGLVDLLQCFEGVARGSQSHSALVLFQFLHPVLQRCVGLMRTRAHAQAVVSTILELLLNVTTKVSIYIDEADSSRLYETLLQIIDGYRLEHTQRLVSLTECDEEKAGDLILFIEILSNVLSKDILSNETDRVSTGAQVTMESLKMLLTVMNENVVRLPEVALKFYRLILYLVEFSPEALTTMSSDLLASLCECIKLGMTGSFGNEITSTSLEALTEVAKHFSQEVNRSRVTANLVDQFHLLLPLVFETCLSFTCETSIFSEACSALYMIISFDFDFYQRFVEDLLTKKSNQAAANVIRNAFAELMPSPPVQVRRERVLFRGRMEAFLNKVQGILSYN